MNSIEVRPLVGEDWADVRRIYAEGIATGNATFEAVPPSWEAFDRGRLETLRFVAELDGVIGGWAAASPVSAREVYRGVVEHSVYVSTDARGLGLGGALLGHLVAEAERLGVWTIQSNVFPENIASLHLHESHGFRVVGRRERIALMSYGPSAGRWRDTILIERRSPSLLG